VATRGERAAVGTSVIIELRDHAAKKRSGRLIPLHKDLRDTLASWRSVTLGAGPVVLSERGCAMTPLSIVVWFARAYRAVGLEGCSSHSGRRTFITRAARLVHKVTKPPTTAPIWSSFADRERGPVRQRAEGSMTG
jgi:integrase